MENTVQPQESEKPFYPYQPIPFPGDWGLFQRKDCEERYQVIKANLPDFRGMSLVDVGCANGYFGFRFLQDGGGSVLRIENDARTRKFTEDLAEKFGMNFKCHDYFFTVPKDLKFDIGFYLDLHFHNGINAIEFMKERCRLVFASPGGTGAQTSPIMEKQLKEYFSEVIPLWDKTEGRVLYKCSG